MCIPKDDPILDIILDTIPCEGPETWSDDDMFQIAYKKAGLKRYAVDTVESMLKKTKTLEEAKVVTSTTYGKDKDKALSGGSAGSMDMKLEVKAYALLQVEAKVVAAAEKQMAKALSELKSQKAAVGVLLKTTESQRPKILYTQLMKNTSLMIVCVSW